MPNYEYKCDKCGYKHEHIVVFDDRDMKRTCLMQRCDGELKRQIGAVNLHGFDRLGRSR